MIDLRHILTDLQAAKLVAQTHPLFQQSDERPSDFILRIVKAYDNAKEPNFINKTETR